MANMVDAKKKVWVGELFGGPADEQYSQSACRIAAQYNAASQIKKLVEAVGGFNELFLTKEKSQHPEILKAHLRGDVSIETFVLLDMCVNFFPKLDKDLEDDRMWFMLRNKSSKYRPLPKNELGLI